MHIPASTHTCTPFHTHIANTITIILTDQNTKRVKNNPQKPVVTRQEDNMLFLFLALMSSFHQQTNNSGKIRALPNIEPQPRIIQVACMDKRRHSFDPNLYPTVQNLFFFLSEPI